MSSFIAHPSSIGTALMAVKLPKLKRRHKSASKLSHSTPIDFSQHSFPEKTHPPVPKRPVPVQRPEDPSLDIFQELTDLPPAQLHKLLSVVIQKERDQLQLITARHHLLKQITNELSPNSSERDVKKIYGLVKHAADNIEALSRAEIELGEKSRLLEKQSIQYSLMKAKFESLQNRHVITEQELKEIKERLKSLQDEFNRQVKVNHSEKNKSSRMIYAELLSKFNALAEGLDSLKAINNTPAVGKIRGAITALMRNAEDYRKEIKKL